MPSPRFPDIAEPGSVVIGTRFADSAGVQRRAANTEADELDRARQPGGLTAVSWFLSPDGETLLSCAQWSSDVAHDTYLRGSGFLPPLAGPPRYRLYRSSADTTDARTPGCLITAAFDVDGPERQRSFTEAVIAAQSQDDSHPGAISAHFLHSIDGSRVLLYTEWTSIEAHQQAVAAGDHDTAHEIFAGTPGVRPTHGGRWQLQRSLRASRT